MTIGSRVFYLRLSKNARFLSKQWWPLQQLALACSRYCYYYYSVALSSSDVKLEVLNSDTNCLPYHIEILCTIRDTIAASEIEIILLITSEYSLLAANDRIFVTLAGNVQRKYQRLSNCNVTYIDLTDRLFIECIKHCTIYVLLRDKKVWFGLNGMEIIKVDQFKP